MNRQAEKGEKAKVRSGTEKILTVEGKSSSDQDKIKVHHQKLEDYRSNFYHQRSQSELKPDDVSAIYRKHRALRTRNSMAPNSLSGGAANAFDYYTKQSTFVESKGENVNSNVYSAVHQPAALHLRHSSSLSKLTAISDHMPTGRHSLPGGPTSTPLTQPQRAS